MRNLIRNVHNSFDQKWGDDFGCYAMINLLFLQHGFLFSSAFDPICDSCIIKSVAFEPRKFVVKNGKSCEAFGTNSESYLYLFSTEI